MLLKIQKSRLNLSRILICSLSSTLLLTSNVLPTIALGKPQNSQNLIIAKSPDERQPEAVEKGIEQIPPSQPSVSPRRRTPVESPIQPEQTSSNTENSQRTSSADDDDTPRRYRSRVSNSNSNGSNTNSASRPSRGRVSNSNSNDSNTGSGRVHKPNSNVATRNQNFNRSQVYSSATPTYKKINFADVALGILSKNDFKSEGRYFHFYEFEGRENQLVQIRLIGSNDTRRSNNLSLNPLLFLHDPNNNVIVKKGTLEKSSDGDDAFIFARLPMNGTYKIAVTSRDAGEIGRYSLALRNDRASYTLDESDQLTAKSSILKQNGGAYNVSNFQGKKNQLISIRVDSVDEEFSPYVVLLNSHGKAIAINKDKDGVYTALIDRARLPEDDTYYVVVTSKNPQEHGKYRLTIF